MNTLEVLHNPPVVVGDTDVNPDLIDQFEARTSAPDWHLTSEARFDAALAKREAADATTYMHVVGALAVVAEQNAQEERLRAETDPLTKIKNRAWAERVMEELRAENRSFALVLADVDGMKAVNDTHGHEGGDEKIVVVARTLTDNIRHVDTHGTIDLRGDAVSQGRVHDDEYHNAARIGG